MNGGQGGIRTPEGLAPLLHFECGIYYLPCCILTIIFYNMKKCVRKCVSFRCSAIRFAFWKFWMASKHEKARELEILTAKIQAQLSPTAEVLHNVHLDGRISGTKRQIDVLVRQAIGQYEMNIVIDCKDYAKPVDVNGVSEFLGLMNDVGAQKGALVCPKGFSKAAKTYAQKLQIDLYSPVDTDPHHWKADVKAPTICDWRGAQISFGARFSAPLPCILQPDFYKSEIVYAVDTKEPLGSPFKAALLKWNEGRFPTEEGPHESLPIFDKPRVLMNNGYGMLAPFDIYASLYVERELYFGYLPISKLSGFKDELSGGIITNAFEVGILEPNEIEKNWQKLDKESDAPVSLLLKMNGLIAWDVT